MKITVDVNGLEEVQRKLATLSGKQIQSSISMALNKTAAKGQAELTRAITQRYYITAQEVRNSVSISPSSAAQGRLQASIQVFGSQKKLGRSLNMIHFVKGKGTLAKGKGRRKQLRFNIIKGAGPKTIEGAFIGNKGRTVFERVPGQYMSGRVNRSGHSRHAQKIAPVQVVGVSQMFMFNPIRERVIDKIKKEFNVELNRAVDGKLKGYL